MVIDNPSFSPQNNPNWGSKPPKAKQVNRRDERPAWQDVTVDMEPQRETEEPYSARQGSYERDEPQSARQNYQREESGRGAHGAHHKPKSQEELLAEVTATNNDDDDDDDRNDMNSEHEEIHTFIDLLGTGRVF